MGKALEDKLNESNFTIFNSMDDWVRIVGPDGKNIFINQSLREAKAKSPDLEIYLNENLPLNLTSENEAIRDTTVVEEKLISNKYYSIKASPIFIDDTYKGIIEVFRDITRETMMKIELFDANRSMLDDIRFVRKVQSSILPKDRVYGNIDLSGIYNPSENVSGDLYDIVKIDDDKYAFYIADVMGHGVKSSIMTMFIKVSIFSIFDKYPDFSPSQALLKLRKRFYELEMDSSQYFTAWLGIFDFKDHSLTYSNAGHNCPPMIYKKKSGECEYLHANGRMISNIIEPDVYNELSTIVEHGDKILFFTDGAIEATDENKNEFGLQRLEDSFSNHKDLNKVYKEIDDFTWGEQQDDITLAMISYKEN
ncbi:SpoIIE family protein phosphatase [Anaerococcus cruorum]|uniref:SpoIIE family protein phosphatase n=1 Tax=Anaerococcus sp. WGS1529 TaxID=3366812 RepID=UPI00372D4F83